MGLSNYENVEKSKIWYILTHPTGHVLCRKGGPENLTLRRSVECISILRAGFPPEWVSFPANLAMLKICFFPPRTDALLCLGRFFLKFRVCWTIFFPFPSSHNAFRRFSSWFGSWSGNSCSCSSSVVGVVVAVFTAAVLAWIVLAKAIPTECEHVPAIAILCNGSCCSSKVCSY